MTLLVAAASFAVALVIGIPLSIYVTRPIRHDPKIARRFAVIAALFFGAAMLNRRQAQLTQEANDETTRKKDQNSGEPA